MEELDYSCRLVIFCKTITITLLYYWKVYVNLLLRSFLCLDDDPERTQKALVYFCSVYFFLVNLFSEIFMLALLWFLNDFSSIKNISGKSRCDFQLLQFLPIVF